MKVVLNVLGAIFVLLGQVVPFEATEWGIKYLNAHPGAIKPFPLAIGVVASFFFTCTNGPIANAKYGLIVGVDNGRKVINPFWGWLIMCLIITVVINLMLE